MFHSEAATTPVAGKADRPATITVYKASGPIGIELVGSLSAWPWSRTEVLVKAVQPGSLLHGLIDAGDEIVEVNETVVNSATEASRLISGASGELVILRRKPPPEDFAADQTMPADSLAKLTGGRCTFAWCRSARVAPADGKLYGANYSRRRLIYILIMTLLCVVVITISIAVPLALQGADPIPHWPSYPPISPPSSPPPPSPPPPPPELPAPPVRPPAAPGETFWYSYWISFTLAKGQDLKALEAAQPSALSLQDWKTYLEYTLLHEARLTYPSTTMPMGFDYDRESAQVLHRSGTRASYILLLMSHHPSHMILSPPTWHPISGPRLQDAREQQLLGDWERRQEGSGH